MINQYHGLIYDLFLIRKIIMACKYKRISGDSVATGGLDNINRDEINKELNIIDVSHSIRLLHLHKRQWAMRQYCFKHVLLKASMEHVFLTVVGRVLYLDAPRTNNDSCSRASEVNLLKTAIFRGTNDFYFEEVKQMINTFCRDKVVEVYD